MFHSHNPFRQRKIQTVSTAGDGLLRVPYKTFEDAKRAFPACEATALRAWTRSEASRIANKVVHPVEMPVRTAKVVSIFFDLGSVKNASLRSRRFDAVMRMLKRGELEKALARKLVREGKLSKAVL